MNTITVTNKARLAFKTGRIFYGISMIAFGVQQLIIRDFRPEILPPFPSWAHHHAIFPYLTGIALIIAGTVIAGFVRTKEESFKRVCFFTGSYFLMLTLFCQVIYNLFINPNKIIHLGLWAETLKDLAYAGGGFVLADSATENFIVNNQPARKTLFEILLSFGRIFFATTIILYGYCHFLYTGFISQMVPKWFGVPVFWTYFAGICLMGSGICIAFKIFVRPIAGLLALMLFLWFILLHVPDAIANPYLGKGDEIVSAFDALQFCGVALIIAYSKSFFQTKALEH